MRRLILTAVLALSACSFEFESKPEPGVLVSGLGFDSYAGHTYHILMLPDRIDTKAVRESGTVSSTGSLGANFQIVSADVYGVHLYIDRDADGICADPENDPGWSQVIHREGFMLMGFFPEDEIDGTVCNFFS